MSIIGKRFGRLVVLEKTTEHNKSGRLLYLCKCDCGGEKKAPSYYLTDGSTKSCGCLLSEVIKKRNTKHGLRKSPYHRKVYHAWLSLRDRCNNKTNETLNKYYRGRGIKVCERWDDFVEGGNYCNAWQPDVEQDRTAPTIIETRATPPNYMQDAAARGLELRREGFSVVPAQKDVKTGIDFCKAQRLVIHQDSVNLLKELKSYRWKTDKNGNKLDVPVKFADHGSDSLRYAIYSKLTIPSITWGAI
jgi:hypothetical protein